MKSSMKPAMAGSANLTRKRVFYSIVKSQRPLFVAVTRRKQELPMSVGASLYRSRRLRRHH